MGKGLEGHKNSWFVSMFVESEPGTGGYVGCEDGSRCGVKGFDSLEVVPRTYDDSGEASCWIFNLWRFWRNNLGLTQYLQSGL
jgi:hypothetical protein